MAIYEIENNGLQEIERKTFEDLGLKERDDLQRMLRDQIEIISPDTLVIAEEFCDWEESRRRIDLLGIDKNANLVVIELKRSEDGGYMELQSIRYSAMVSAMTFEKAVEVYEKHLSIKNEEKNAEDELLRHLGWEEPQEDLFAQEVRIVLASAEFSIELTTSVLWLNEHGLDIRCVRMRPCSKDNRIFLDIQQIIPLPEAADYVTKIRAKEQQERTQKTNNTDKQQRYFNFWTLLLDRAKLKTKLHSNTSPRSAHWIGMSSGMSGLVLNYVFTKHESTCELYIDKGKDCKKVNKKIYDYIEKHKEVIEQEFGDNLRWERLSDGQASRISKRLHLGGWKDSEDNWPQIADAMVDTMIRLEKVLRPYIEEIKAMQIAGELDE